MPSLEKLHRSVPRERFALMAVSVGETAQVVGSFVKKGGFSLPILLDTRGMVAAQYGVRAHPVAYLVDPGGKLIGIAFGYRRWDRKEMKALIAALHSSEG